MASNRREVDAITRSVDGKGVGAQAFGLYPRIREIDEIRRNSAKARRLVYEIHPELSFMAWNDGEPIKESKRSHEGMRFRLGLTVSHFGVEAVHADPASHVADDDIYDAFAALWTAERIKLGVAEVIPDPPGVDSCGLQMGMWF